MNGETETFIFKFKDNRKITLLPNQVINISTSFYYKHINKENGNVVEMPENIKFENFSKFLEIFQKNIILDEQKSQENKILINDNIDLVQMIEISEFFENDSFSIFIINECILYSDNKLNKKNAYLLLILSL